MMVDEVLEHLAPKRGGRFLDLTVGAGGHSAAVAERLGPSGVLVGIDFDNEILAVARKRLGEGGGPSVHLFQGNYIELAGFLKEAGLTRVDGILLDLGVSSLQLEDAGRGFSFRNDGPLDMRMDQDSLMPTAAQVVNETREEDLADIFYTYGEERLSRRIARRIVEERRREPITRTGRLAEIVRRAYPGRGRRRIDPATRVFQALRIEVNDELANLRGALETAPEILEDGGRIAVIAFHSLEDRIVKEDYRSRARQGLYTLITRKPLTASQAEVDENPRSRSAKLRVAQRSQR